MKTKDEIQLEFKLTKGEPKGKKFNEGYLNNPLNIIPILSLMGISGIKMSMTGQDKISLTKDGVTLKVKKLTETEAGAVTYKISSPGFEIRLTLKTPEDNLVVIGVKYEITIPFLLLLKAKGISDVTETIIKQAPTLKKKVLYPALCGYNG